MRKFASIQLKDGLQIQMQVVNPRQINIKPGNAQYELIDDNGKLVGLDYKGEYLISKGSVLPIGPQKYKISEIRRSSTASNGYELFTFRKITTTANFLLPFLGENRLYWRWNLEFVNSFIGHESKPNVQELSVLYRFSGSPEFGNFEAQLKDHPLFIEATDPDKYTVLFTFKLPEEYKKDVQLITEGKYSKISEKAKARILEFHGSNRQKPTGQVLYKCDARRKKMEKDLGQGWTIPENNELYEMFNLDDEIFKNQFSIKEYDATSTPTGGFV